MRGEEIVVKGLAVLAGLFLLSASIVWAEPPAPVPKTGQLTSYATGDDGDLKKGVAWPVPRFTDNGDGTVTDSLTGLIWLKNADCFNKRSWANALSDCNGLASGSCGLTDGSEAGDWRLPNIKELHSLVDVEYKNPAIPSGHPFSNVRPDGDHYYWSSTDYKNATDWAWRLMMYSGTLGGGLNSTTCYVWPVRDPVETLVEMSSLKTVPGDKKVTIEWETASEIDNAGFNIYRAEGFKKINADLIPAEGSPTEGAAYEFTDDNVSNWKRYFYVVEDLDTEGVSTLHGPVKAVPKMK